VNTVRRKPPGRVRACSIFLINQPNRPDAGLARAIRMLDIIEEVAYLSALDPRASRTTAVRADH
jgi:hypothetical protein